MGRSVLWFVVLVGVCYASAEDDMGELSPTEMTTLGSTTPLPTEPTHSNTKESTSDTWLDLHPGATTEFTTTSATPTVPCTESPQSRTPKNEDESSKEEKDDTAKTPSAENSCNKELSKEDVRKFSDAMMSFSKDLLQKVYQQSDSPNVVMSPFSIALALLQLTLGARRATEKKLLETLHVESLPCVHEKMHKVTRQLVETALSVATRIYVNKDFPIKEDFLEESEKHYGSKPFTLGPIAEENVESINKWVSNVTNGKIKNFLSDLSSNIELILLNAIYFKGIWKNKFDPHNTCLEEFYIKDDQVVKVDMMHATKYPLSYQMSEKLDSLVARLPFKGNTSFVIVMPNQMDWNVSKILENFNMNELHTRFNKEKPTTLKVPKLSLDFKMDLEQILRNLGLGQLFKNPDLKGISDKDLVVSAVKHQSVLDLNEEGVEAAATTAVLASRSLSTFSVNRPFLYFLFNKDSNWPLFQGYVREPKPGTPKKCSSSSEKLLFKGSLPK